MHKKRLQVTMAFSIFAVFFPLTFMRAFGFFVQLNWRVRDFKDFGGRHLTLNLLIWPVT